MRNFPGLEQKSRSPHGAFGLSYDVEAQLKLKHEVSQNSKIFHALLHLVRQ